MVGSRVLEDLRVEHRAMGKLLELLEHQLDLVAQDRRPDDELLLQIAEYFASVPDIYHHPKEDVVLRRLVARHPGFAEIAGLLEAEHEEGDREVQRSCMPSCGWCSSRTSAPNAFWMRDGPWLTTSDGTWRGRRRTSSSSPSASWLGGLERHRVPLEKLQRTAPTKAGSRAVLPPRPGVGLLAQCAGPGR